MAGLPQTRPQNIHTQTKLSVPGALNRIVCVHCAALDSVCSNHEAKTLYDPAFSTDFKCLHRTK